MFGEDDHYLPKKNKFTKNPLLRHSRVGKRRERTDKYPPENFTYGRPGPTGEPSAGEVIHQWKFHTPNDEAAPSRDFVRTNKEAVDSGCIDAKQNATFRFTKMYRQHKGPFPNKEEESFHKRLDKMTFGRKNKTSTPIHRVVTGEFQRAFIANQKKALKPKANSKRLPRAHSVAKNNTPAVESHSQPASGLFKMKKFLDVGSRVEVPNPKYRRSEDVWAEEQGVMTAKHEAVRKVPEETTCDAPSAKPWVPEIKHADM